MTATLGPLLAQGDGGGGNTAFIISLVLLVGIFYFLLIRPQRRRVQQQRDLIQSLVVGDEVITIGGIYGRIIEMDDDSVTLDIAPGTQVRLVKSAVARKLTQGPDIEPGQQAEEQP